MAVFIFLLRVDVIEPLCISFVLAFVYVVTVVVIVICVVVISGRDGLKGKTHREKKFPQYIVFILLI
jgi:hypothetical protein